MPKSPALSVVIPTRDRQDRLLETLEALAEDGNDLELVVVDDGSTEPLPQTLLDGLPFPSRLLRQEGLGPATARNRGITATTGRRVLLLGDDTRPAPGGLAPHRDEPRELGIQGHIDWDPELPVSDVMHFLAPAGPQFYFKGLTAGEPVPFTAILGSNYSAPRHWFLEEPFDEGFPHAALEDTELAVRFENRGWTSIYQPQALCWHHHPYPDLAPFLARQRRAGASLRYFLRRHPQLAGTLVLRPTAYGLAVALRGLARRLAGRDTPSDAWDLRCRAALTRGLLFGVGGGRG